ncbi:MAG: GNAT family N-acetyltransferase [Thermoanaerobaculia bacterium]|nr:GNAT family N-acetyltransferase [Thermoanaerobaculia bacterium]
MEIRNDTDQNRFEVVGLDEGRGVLEYRRTGDVLALNHTFVSPEARGQGIAAQLVRAALDHAREEGLTVKPHCSYVASYMEDHPDDQDLLAQGFEL